MSLKTKANAQAGTPQRRPGAQGSADGTGLTGLVSALCVAAISLATLGSAVAAETPVLLLEAASPAPILAYTSLATAPTMASLWLSAGSTPAEAGLLGYYAEERQSSSLLLRWQTEPGDLTFQHSLLVAPVRVESRFSYLAWAALHTGFGEYWLTDGFPRLRTNGAGAQNPRSFFVKLSFRL